MPSQGVLPDNARTVPLQRPPHPFWQRAHHALPGGGSLSHLKDLGAPKIGASKKLCGKGNVRNLLWGEPFAMLQVPQRI